MDYTTNLPDEVLVEILQYLDINLNIVLVCRKWRDVIYTFLYPKKMKLAISDSTTVNNRRQKCIPDILRIFTDNPDFRIQHVAISFWNLQDNYFEDHFTEFFQIFGPQIRILEIIFAIMEPRHCGIFDFLPNLTHLDLKDSVSFGSAGIVIPEIPSLKSLSICYRNHNDVRYLLVHNLAHLRELSLLMYHLPTDDDVIRIDESFKTKSLTIKKLAIFNNSQYESLDNVFSLFRKLHNLTHLTFKTDHRNLDIQRTICLNLTQLVYLELTTERLIEADLLTNLHNLETFKLGVDFFDEDWPRIVSMPKVKTLELLGVETAHNFVASFPSLRSFKASQSYLAYALDKLVNLEKLELTTRITDTSIKDDNENEKDFYISKLKSLKELKLLQLPEKFVKFLCLPNLKVLDLGHGNKKFGPKTFEVLVKNCPNLVSLSVGYIGQRSSAEISEIILKNLPNLKYLNAKAMDIPEARLLRNVKFGRH